MSSAVELIKSEINKRAREESERIILDAKRKAEEMVSSAEAKAREIMMASVKPEVEILRRRILGSAHLEGRKMLLQIKNDFILKVLSAVEKRLRTIANERSGDVDYRELLFKLLDEAVSKLGEDEVIVNANRNDLSYLSANMQKIKRRLSEKHGRSIKLVLADEPRDYIGGLTVKSVDGKRVFNNTLEGRLLSMHDILRGRILEAIRS